MQQYSVPLTTPSKFYALVISKQNDWKPKYYGWLLNPMNLFGFENFAICERRKATLVESSEGWGDRTRQHVKKFVYKNYFISSCT